MMKHQVIFSCVSIQYTIGVSNKIIKLSDFPYVIGAIVQTYILDLKDTNTQINLILSMHK